MVDGVRISTWENDPLRQQGITRNLPNDLAWKSNRPHTILPQESQIHSPGTPEVKNQVDPLGTDRVQGYRVPMYFEDYYNQVWVMPRSLDFGAIGAESSKQFFIWNAYWRQSTTLQSIHIENGDGTRLDGPPSPKVYKPLEYHTYTVTVEAEGPAVVNTTYTMRFSDGMVIEFPVTGSRAKLWPFSVNWSDSYNVAYEYRTEIITSWSGREQRIAHRRSPRRKVSFTTLMHGENLNYFKNLMWSWQTKPFVLPEITHRTTTAADMASQAESTVIALPHPSWLLAEANVIMESGTQREIKVIERIDGPNVFFKSTSRLSWPKGTTVYLAITGFFDPSVATMRKTSTTVNLGFTLNIVPLSEKFAPPPVPKLTIGGREIFDKRPNWADDVPVTHEHQIEELDYGQGPVARFTPIQFGTMLRSHTYLARNLEEADEMVDVFRRNLGQQGEFYVPTWEHDVFPKVRAEATTQTMRIAGRDIFEAYQGTTVNKGLAVRFKDGRMLYRLIESIGSVSDNDGNDSAITITQPWGVVVDPAEVEYVSWLLLCRFASDQFNVEFLTDSVAQFKVTLRSLENLPPEA